MFKPLLALALWFYAGWSLGAFFAFTIGAPDFGLVMGVAFGAAFWLARGRFLLRQATDED